MNEFIEEVNGARYLVQETPSGIVMVSRGKNPNNPRIEETKTISRVEDGWQLVRNISGRNITTTTILKDNNDIAITNSFAKPGEEPEILENKFDKDKKDGLNFAEQDALDIFTMLEQIKGKVDIKINPRLDLKSEPKMNSQLIPEDIMQVRIQSLQYLMGILGVNQNLEFLPDESCCSLSEIGDMLETYNPLSFIERDHTAPKGYKVDESRLGSIDEFMAAYNNLKTDSQNSDQDRTSDKEYKYQIGSMAGKLASIKEGLSPEELSVYGKVSILTAKYILALNGDLFTSEQLRQWGIKDFSRLSNMNREDCISSLIDSKPFAKACETENEFVVNQSNRVINWIENQGSLDSPEVNFYMKTMLHLLKQTAEEKRDSRLSRIGKVDKSLATSTKKAKKKEVDDFEFGE